MQTKNEKTILQREKSKVKDLRDSYEVLRREHSRTCEELSSLKKVIKFAGQTALPSNGGNGSSLYGNNSNLSPEDIIIRIVNEVNFLRSNYECEKVGTIVQTQTIITLRNLLRAAIGDETLVIESRKGADKVLDTPSSTDGGF